MAGNLNNLHVFVQKKTSILTLSGLRLALWQLTISPAVEKTLSAGTDVAGMQRYFLASLARVG